jgi:Zn-dependent protease/predicted transcriptional regulator
VGLITWSLSVGYFPAALPHLAPADYWARGLAAALLLFVSVFLHELSHTLMALALGIPVTSITLHLFGGVSRMEREPDSPRTEFLVAVVGPITSFVLAGLLAGAAAAVEPGAGTRAILHYLATVNLVLGAFNLVPGFPLDGGRLLRATLWRFWGGFAWATRMASRAGSAFALVLIGLGALQVLAGQILGGVWFVLIGLFLQGAAESSYREMVLRHVLEPLTVRKVMTREVVHLEADDSVGDGVDMFWRHHVASLPVLDDGRLIGILSLARIKEIDRHRRGDTSVRDVMLPMTGELAVHPGDSLWDTLQRLERNGLGRAAVLEAGRLVGYVSTKDVSQAVALEGDGRDPERVSTAAVGGRRAAHGQADA